MKNRKTRKGRTLNCKLLLRHAWADQAENVANRQTMCIKSPEWCVENMVAGVKSPWRTHRVSHLPAIKNRKPVGLNTLKVFSTDPTCNWSGHLKSRDVNTAPPSKQEIVVAAITGSIKMVKRQANTIYMRSYSRLTLNFQQGSCNPCVGGGGCT